jgi:hypothetical protein
MNKIAQVIYGRIKATYETQHTFGEWKLNHSPALLFIDVTGTDARVGDDVQLNDDGTYTIVPQEEWFRLQEKRLLGTSTLTDEKKAKLQELEDYCGKVLGNTFLQRVAIPPKSLFEAEQQALDYVSSGAEGIMLKEMARAENVDLKTMAGIILAKRSKITEVNDYLVTYYADYRKLIEGAKSVEELASIEFKGLLG